MLDKGDLLTLDDHEEYIVVSTVIYEEKPYVYLITNDSNSDTMICLFNEQTQELETVTEEDVLKKIIPLLQKDIEIEQ